MVAISAAGEEGGPGDNHHYTTDSMAVLFSPPPSSHIPFPSGLPPGKPRYVMGIGYPLDIVVCSALGADMYDSVYPTRTARFGVALVPEGVLKLKNAEFASDFR